MIHFIMRELCSVFVKMYIRECGIEVELSELSKLKKI